MARTRAQVAGWVGMLVVASASPVAGGAPEGAKPEAAATPAAAPSAKGDRDVSALLEMMTGAFSSEAQSKADGEYRHIVLHMAPIWTERADGPWLYVEQALGPKDGRQFAPYRQRVYRLVVETRGGAKAVRSDVYTLPGDREAVVKNFAGAWKDPGKLAGLTPDKLVLREGCSLVLTRGADGTFVGATGEKSCPSELQGAAYATSQAHIRPDGMLTWDRGFDKEGNQVWGATKGGYRFDKLPPEPAKGEPSKPDGAKPDGAKPAAPAAPGGTAPAPSPK